MIYMVDKIAFKIKTMITTRLQKKTQSAIHCMFIF